MYQYIHIEDRITSKPIFVKKTKGIGRIKYLLFQYKESGPLVVEWRINYRNQKHSCEWRLCGWGLSGIKYLKKLSLCFSSYMWLILIFKYMLILRSAILYIDLSLYRFLSRNLQISFLWVGPPAYVK